MASTVTARVSHLSSRFSTQGASHTNSGAFLKCTGLRQYSTGGVSAKVARFYEHGNPESVLKVETENLQAPKSNEVIVKVLKAPINYFDLNVVQGGHPEKLSLPLIAGNAGVGEVVSVGSGVKDLKPNDWVVPRKLGLGTWSTHFVANSGDVVAIRKDVKAEEGATLLTAAAAYRLLQDFAELKAGDVVVQNGADGTLGSIVRQLARERNIKTINIVSAKGDINDLKKRITSEGGEFVLDNQVAPQSLPKARLALNAQGGWNTHTLAQLLDQNGVLVTYAGSRTQPVTLASSQFIFNNITVRGFSLQRWAETHSAEQFQQTLNAITDLIKNKKLQIATEDVPFSKLVEALTKFKAPTRSKKLLLDPTK